MKQLINNQKLYNSNFNFKNKHQNIILKRFSKNFNKVFNFMLQTAALSPVAFFQQVYSNRNKNQTFTVQLNPSKWYSNFICKSVQNYFFYLVHGQFFVRLLFLTSLYWFDHEDLTFCLKVDPYLINYLCQFKANLYLIFLTHFLAIAFSVYFEAIFSRFHTCWQMDIDTLDCYSDLVLHNRQNFLVCGQKLFNQTLKSALKLDFNASKKFFNLLHAQCKKTSKTCSDKIRLKKYRLLSIKTQTNVWAFNELGNVSFTIINSVGE